jgi:hypothetical protein
MASRDGDVALIQAATKLPVPGCAGTGSEFNKADSELVVAQGYHFGDVSND